MTFIAQLKHMWKGRDFSTLLGYSFLFCFCFCFNILLKYSSIYIEKGKYRSIQLNDFHKRLCNQHIDKIIDHTGIPTWCYRCPRRNFREAATKGLSCFHIKRCFLRKSLKVGKTYCFSLPINGHAYACMCFQYMRIWFYATSNMIFFFSSI